MVYNRTYNEPSRKYGKNIEKEEDTDV